MAVVFVIHAPEDAPFFDRLTAHARSAKLAVEFDRMQVKLTTFPDWQGKCRDRIYRCSGAIVFLSKHTQHEGVGWELECTRSFNIPMLGVRVDSPSGSVPEALSDSTVIDWNWPQIARFIESLTKGASAFSQAGGLRH